MKKHVLSSFIKITFKIYKSFYFFTIFKAIIDALLIVFNAFSLSILINYLEKGVYVDALYCGLFICLINLTFYFISIVTKRLSTVFSEKLIEKINIAFSKKLMSVPFPYLEDPYYLDLKERAVFAASNQGAVEGFVHFIAKLISDIVSIISLIGIMLSFDYLLFFIVLLGVAINFVIILLSMRMQLKFYENLLPINRRYGYYIDNIFNHQQAKDFRFYKLGDFMNEQFKHYSEKSAKEISLFLKKVGFIKALSNIIRYVEMGFIYIFIALKTITRKLSISQFSLYISSSIAFFDAMLGMINDGISLTRNVAYVAPFVELFQLKEENSGSSSVIFQGKFETVEFKDVSFTYPHSEQEVLSNISFKINKGEKISLVGLNGAGKTTLIKLLCRLYEPSKGTILVNGLDIFDYEYHSYIEKISAVFQDYHLFAYSLKENIIGEENDASVAYDEACKVGLKEKIDSLPHGIESTYLKIYDEEGIELSGGEAQKVAIARALHKNGDLVILDEPTSALDPLSEADIYQRFHELTQDKMSIYISHRMSSSVFCDKVLVLNHGRIEDFDTHQNLMDKKETLYYQLFMSQAKNYQLEE